MRRCIKVSAAVVLLFIILCSCSSGFNYSKAYEAQQYYEIISQSTEDMKSTLTAETVYYRLLSFYKIGDYEEASLSAELYCILKNDDYDERLHEALRLILFYGDEDAALESGRRIYEHYEMNVQEQSTYFQLLMGDEDYEEATRFYNEIRGGMTGRQAAEMLIAAKASSVLIVSNLEAWFSESGQDSKLVDAVISTISLLNTRGEGELIIPLALSLTRADTPRLSLAIGDLYYSLGYQQRARVYWAEAREAFPSLIERKFTSLSS